MQVIEELHHALGFPLFFDPPAASAVRGGGAPSSSNSNSFASPVTPTFKSLDLHIERYKELNMLLEKVGRHALERSDFRAMAVKGSVLWLPEGYSTLLSGGCFQNGAPVHHPPSSCSLYVPGLLAQGILCSSPDQTPLHLVGGQDMTKFADAMREQQGAGAFIILKFSIQVR